MDVEKAIFHEAMEHYGVRVLFGKEWVGCKSQSIIHGNGWYKRRQRYCQKEQHQHGHLLSSVRSKAYRTAVCWEEILIAPRPFYLDQTL